MGERGGAKIEAKKKVHANLFVRAIANERAKIKINDESAVVLTGAAPLTPGRVVPS